MKRFLLILFILLFAFAGHSQTQEATTESDSTKTDEPSAFLIVDIIDNMRDTTEDLVMAKKRAEPSSSIAIIDSLLPDFNALIESEIRNTEIFLQASPNRQKVDNYIGKWRVHEAKLNQWKSEIVSQISENAKVLDELNPNIVQWKIVVKDTIFLKSPQEFIGNVNDITEDLNSTFEKIKQDIIGYLRIEAEVSNLLTLTEEAIINLSAFKRSNVYNYLYKRHAVLWKSSNEVSAADSSNINQIVLKREANKIVDYAKSSPNQVVNFILIVLLLVFLVRYLRRSFIKYPLTNKEEYLQHFEDLFLKHYRTVIVFLSLLVLRVFMDDFEKLFIDIIGTLLLIVALPIIRPYEDRSFRSLFTFLVFLVLFDNIKSYAWFSSLQYRIFLLFEALLTLGILFIYVRPYYLKKKQLTEGNFAKTVIKVSPLLAIILLVAIGSNLLGYTNLTDLCLKICILMGGVSIIFYASLLLAESIAISIINRHYSVNPGYSITERKTVERKVLNVLKFFAYILWVMFFLRVIDKLNPLYDFLEITLTETYTVGSIEFTLGAIFSFFIVLIISYVLSSIVAFLINDGNGALKVFNLSKGVPAAISVVVRYVIIGFGFIFAISILGIDLSTFNLMAGALGLGIGFGLQTIISNFVSGLILIFERPILPGDSVEVNSLWGTVKKIGVRASVINTYDGAEVIVPNNNLISNDLINWTLSSKLRRMEIAIGTAYGSDPNEVLQILKETALSHPNVLKDPEPLPLFKGFGDSSLDFTLWYWVYFENGLGSKSQISVDIYNKLDEAGIEIPFPQRDVHIKSVTKGNEKPDSDIGFKSTAD